MSSLFSKLGGSPKAPKSPPNGTDDQQTLDGAKDSETEVLDESEGSIIMSLISQLRIGMDLSKVTFPTFVLEPRSMLERITDFMSHPDLIFGAENEQEAETRFLKVLRYYMSGWHNKPRGVKKPYNPVLGEFFRCRFEYKDGSSGFYVAEQVSHHPPISAYYYISPANKVMIAGEFRPKSKFLGNSVATIMEGESRVYLMGKEEDGVYRITMPNMYARGILFGKMVLELGETSAITNPATEMSCEVQFKTKGMFSGTYNAIAGKVKKGSSDVGELSGTWNESMSYKSKATHESEILFDVSTDGKNMPKKLVSPESEQEPNESRRLWSKLTNAIRNKNMDAATESKAEVEDAQREDAKKREESGQKHVPRFFELRDGLWHATIELPQGTEEQITAVQTWIWPEGSARP
ncbi:Oxysterol-binding protein [Clavulina sp. PMI_390]|nr:Oxysterol-binding protein [Clavulina sp. PMI_390]